jgi:hypothetical protein
MQTVRGRSTDTSKSNRVQGETMSELREFYNKVSRAREMCAGSNVQRIGNVKACVCFAVRYGNTHGINREYLTKLTEVMSLLNEAREYKDRLKPDTILCDILNAINNKGV